MLSDFLWMQLATQYLFSVFMVIYLTYFRPLELFFTNRLEAFNECCCVVLMYHIMCFSDFVPSAETRNGLGYSFIVSIFANVAVHLFFMLRESYLRMKRRIMRKCCHDKWLEQQLVRKQQALLKV